MSGKSGTNTVTQNSAPPQQYLNAYQNVLSQAQNVASQPLQQYAGNQVAGFSPDQTSAINTVDSSQGIADPYINSAAQEFGNITQPVMGQASQNYLNAAANGAVTNTANAGAGGIQTAANAAGQGDTNAGINTATGVQTAANTGVAGINSASTAFNPNSINQFESPYTQQVVGATQAEFNNQNAQTSQALTGNAVAQGAYGGDRSAVAQGVAAGQEAQAQAPVIAGLENTGYQNATAAAEQQAALGLQGATSAGQLGVSGASSAGQLGLSGITSAGQLGLTGATSAGQLAQSGATTQAQLEQGVGQSYLGADEAQDWLGSQAAFGMSSLGQEAQNSTLTGANAQMSAGNAEQSLAQANLNVPYEEFQQQQAYPFQTTGWLGGIAEGTGSAAGGTGSSSSTSTPSALSDITGAATTGLGVAGLTGGFGSSGWLSSLFGSGATDAAGAGTISGAGDALGALLAKRGGAIPARAWGGGIAGNDNLASHPSAHLATGTHGIIGGMPHIGGMTHIAMPHPPGFHAGGIMGYAPGGGVTVPQLSGGPGGAISVSVAPGMNGGVSVPTLGFNPGASAGGSAASPALTNYLNSNMGSPGAGTKSPVAQPNFVPAATPATPGGTTVAPGITINRGASDNAGGSGNIGGGHTGITPAGPSVASVVAAGPAAGVSGSPGDSADGGIGGVAAAGNAAGVSGSAGDGGDGGDGNARGGIIRRADSGNIPDDLPVPPIPPDQGAPSGGIAGPPDQGAAPSSYAVDYKPRQGPSGDVAAIRAQAPWLGVLGAGLGILGGKSTNGVANIGQGALEGLKLYAGENQRADQLQQQQDTAQDTGARALQGFKLDAQKMTDAVADTKARLAQTDAAQAETANYHQGELGIQQGELGLKAQGLALENKRLDLGKFTYQQVTQPDPDNPTGPPISGEMKLDNTGLHAPEFIPTRTDPNKAGANGQISGREGVMINRVIAAGNEAATSASNIMELPTETTSTGWLGGRQQSNGIFGALKESLANSLTPQSVQDYNTMIAGVSRNLATIEAQGLAPAGSLTHSMDSVTLKEGDSEETKLRKMAELRQIVEKGLEPSLSNPRIPQQQKDLVTNIIGTMQKVVPYTQHDVTMFQTQGQPNETFGDYAKRQRLGQPQGGGQQGAAQPNFPDWRSSPSSVAALRKTPAMAPQFDAIFGPNASRAALGQ
jgi:hypothetical protein